MTQAASDESSDQLKAHLPALACVFGLLSNNAPRESVEGAAMFGGLSDSIQGLAAMETKPAIEIKYLGGEGMVKNIPQGEICQSGGGPLFPVGESQRLMFTKADGAGGGEELGGGGVQSVRRTCTKSEIIYWKLRQVDFTRTCLKYGIASLD